MTRSGDPTNGLRKSGVFECRRGDFMTEQRDSAYTGPPDA